MAASTPNPRPELAPTWRTRAVTWAFGFKFADDRLHARAKEMVEKLALPDHVLPGGLYVDVGSGTGHITTQLARKTRGKAARYLCVEPVSRPTWRVRRFVEERTEGGVYFARATGDELPVDTDAADGVSAYFVLHHIPYDTQLAVLADMKRVLRPGGLMFLWEDTPTNPVEFAASEALDRRRNFEARSAPHFYRSGDDWAELLAGMGFTVVHRHDYDEPSTLGHGKTRVRHTGLILRLTG